MAFFQGFIIGHGLAFLSREGSTLSLVHRDRLDSCAVAECCTLSTALIYNPEAEIRTIKNQPGLITLDPDVVTITQVTDSADR